MSGTLERYNKKHPENSNSTLERYMLRNPDYSFESETDQIETNTSKTSENNTSFNQKAIEGITAVRNTLGPVSKPQNTLLSAKDRLSMAVTGKPTETTKKELDSKLTSAMEKKRADYLAEMATKDYSEKPVSLMSEEEKQALKAEYESIPNYNVFQSRNLDINNKVERKQKLYNNYRELKNEDAYNALINHGFTDEEIRYLNGDPISEEELRELEEQGLSEEEIIDISNQRADAQMRAMSKFEDVVNSIDDSWGVTSEDVTNMVHDRYAISEIRKDAEKHPVSNSLFTIAANPFESALSAGANVYNYVTGRPLRNYQTGTDVIRDTVSQNIDSQFGRTVYGGAMSLGDMAAAVGTAYATGGGSIVSAGIQALEKASQVMGEGADRGLSADQIFAEGIASGLTTYVTEKIPMGKLEEVAEKGLTDYSAREIGKYLGSMFISEGLQEGAEDIADWAMDAVVAWDKNEFNTDVQNYIAQGLSPKDAVAKVVSERAAEMMTDVVIGGISGAAVGGSAVGTGYITGKVNAPSVNTDAVMESPEALNRLIEAAQTLKSDSDLENADRIEYAKELANKPVEELQKEDVVDIANVLNEQADASNNYAQAIQEINYRAGVESNLNQYEQTGTITPGEYETQIESAARQQAESIVKEHENSLRQQERQAQRNLNKELRNFENNIQNYEKAEVAPVQQEALTKAAEGFENETAAKTYMNNYSGQNLELYTKTSYLAYRAGESGQSFDTFMKNSNIASAMVEEGEISEAYLKNLYYNGQNARTVEEENPAFIENENLGKATEITSDDKLAEFKIRLAKKLGIEVNTNHTDTTSRGNFSAALARITVNVTADNEYAALVHEMFEFARAYDAKGMENAEKALVNMVVNKSSEAKFVKAVEEYRDAYRRAGQNAPEGSALRSEANKTFSEAQEEFINDAISYIFSSDEGMQNLVDYIMSDNETSAEEKVSAIQAIKDWVDHLIQTIKDFISGHKSKQLAYDYTEKLGLTSEELESISRMLTGVLDTARENLAKQTKIESKESGEETVAHSVSTEVFRDSEDRNIYNFAEDAINKRIDKDNKIVISDRISDKAGEEIFETIGVDAKGYKNTLIAERVQHIWDRHGVHGTADRSMANIHDIAQIEYVVDNYDGMTKGKGQFQFKNKDNTYADTVLLWKKMDDEFYYVVEAVPDTKKKTLYVVTAYKNNASPEVLMPNGLRRDARNELQSDAFISDSNIAESEEKSNKKGDGKKNFSLYVPVEDSEGRKLSKEQQEYFKDSKIVDENGNLKVMYHGTNSAGFTVFERSDDGISYFFTDNKKVASTYSRVDYFENPDKPMSFEELSDAAKNVTDGSFREEKGKIIFEDYDGTTKAFKSIKDAQNWLIDEHIASMTAQGMGSPSNYEVYLNAKNPLVVDANGSDWNDLPAQSWNKHYGDVDITYSDGTYEVEYMDGETFEWHHDVFDSKKALENKFGKIPELNGFSTAFLSDIYLDKKNQRVPTTTREYAEYAKNNGYDSVIFNNIVDNGMYVDNEIESQVVVVFNSNQVKSIYNENPTDNPDIRFSLDVPVEDSEGRKLSKEQQEYFKNSKIRDDEGNLLRVYHGTMGDFTVFDLSEARGSEDIEAFFFSPVLEEAEGYGNIREFYLNITNPADYDTAYGIFHKQRKEKPSGAGVRTREELISLGYDGVAAVDSTNPDYPEYLAFYPEQIKLVSNTKPTSNEDIRFSLDVPVEETKNLIAVHNLSDEKLKGVLELGGFPMPSIAITKADMDHSKFGPISVVFRKDTIDPKQNRYNKVYSGDAYTPTFPTVEYKIDSDKVWDVEKKVNDILGKDFDSLGYSSLDLDNVTDSINRWNGDYEKAFGENYTLKQAFLKDNGIDVDLKYTEEPIFSKLDNDQLAALNGWFLKKEYLEEISHDFEYGNKHPDELKKIRDLMNKVVADSWQAEIEDDMRLYRETGKERYKKMAESLQNFFDETSFSSFDLRNLANALLRYREQGRKKVVDKYKSRDEVKKQMEGREAEYQNWLNNLFDGVIIKKGLRNNKDLFTPQGNRRSWDVLHDDYSLTNIVNNMRKEPTTGQSFGGYSFFGGSTREFESIEDIKSESDRLQIMEDSLFTEAEKEIESELYDIANHIKPSGSWDTYSAVSDIAEAVAKYKTKNGVKKFLSQWYKVSDSDIDAIMVLNKRAKELPTGYFEAKPQRAVGLDEVAAVVVPSNDTEMIDLLNEKGLPVKTYERGDKQSRVDAVNSVEGIRFSLSVPVDSEGNKLSEGQQAFFADSKVRDEQGRLMRMYHGTPNGTFTVFKGGSYFTNMAWYAGRYQNQGASSLGYKKTADNPRTYEAYLNITKPFDTRDPEIKKIWDDQYYHKWDTGEIADSGLPDWTSAEGLLEFIDENELDFDGLIIDEGGIPGDDGEVISRGLAWVPINGREQVKSIDNLNPTEDPDIRFSIDVDAFMDAFDEIDNQVELNENELHELIENRMDLESDVSKKMISDVASNIKKLYNSGIDKKKLESGLRVVFRYLKNTARYTMEDVMTVMTDIARPVLENVKAASPEQEALYKDFVDFVKGYQIALDPGQMQEVKHNFNSYTDFKRMMAGKMKLDKNGTMLDDIWTEIADRSNGKLSYGTNPNDQPIELARYIQSLNPTYQTLQGQTLDSAATDLALEIFRQFYVQQSMTDAAEKVKDEITRRSHDMHDKYKTLYNEALKQVESEKAINVKRLADEIEALTVEEQDAIRNGDAVTQALIENVKRDYQERYDRLQAQSNDKIAQARAQYQNSWINKNLRRERSELKQRVLKEVKALQNILAHPAEGATKHVPVKLIKPTIEMLEAINLDNGGANKAIAERLKKMAEVYDSFKNDDTYGFDYDERLASDIEELKELFLNRSYADLEITELYRVIEIVQALKTQIKNANNLILQGRLQDAKEAAENSIRDVKRSRRYDNAATNALNRYGNIHLNAYREFRKLSGYKQDSDFMKLYEDLDEGSHREMQIQKDLGAIFKDVLEGQKNQKEVKKFISTKPEDLVELGTNRAGKPIKITRAMRMSLILHSMNAGNMRHILGSGITVPNMYYFEKGKLEEAYAKGTNYRFVDYAELLNAIQNNNEAKIKELTTKAEERIEKMKEDLSPWEKDFLAAAEKMFHDETGKLINETSMKLKGYAIARVKNYFPIRTDSHFTAQEWAGLVRDGSLEGMGMLKERVTSTKPILLEDVTNVIQRQIGSVSKYAGYAVPLRNFEMIMKQTSRDQETGELHNLAETIDTVWGANDTKWLKNLLQDIQGGRKENRNFLMNLRGQFAGATLTLNPSVAIKQAASYPTAAAVVGYKALARAAADIRKGFITAQGIEELERINPLLWYRNQGNATQELADAKAVGFGKNLPLWAQRAINWTQWFDTGTVRALEYASMYYVDENFKNLEKGSKKYWEKVSEVFTNVVEQTQPNYSTLHKADIIRNPNSLVKMLVMFKTQPMQNFGIIYDAMGELNAAKISGNKAWVKEASSKAALAISSQVVSASVFSAMTILSQLLLHRWWKYRDDDEKWSWEKFWVAFGTGALSCMTGALIGGSELYEALKHIFTGSTYYGIEVSVAEMVNDLVDNIGTLTKNAKALWDAETSEDKEKATQKLLKASAKLGATFGEFKGTPVNNIKNMLSSIYYYATDIVRSIDEGELSISNESDPTSWEIKSQYERIYEALQTGDTDKYNKLVEELKQKSMKEKSEELKEGTVTEDDIAAKVEESVTSKITSLMKADYLEGNITEEEMQDFLVNERGKTEEQAYFQMRRWSTGETSDYGTAKKLISTATADPTPENRKAVIDEIETLLAHGKEKGEIGRTITTNYKDEYILLYKEGKAADLNSILRTALKAAGYTDEEAKKKLNDWVK